MKCTLSTLAVAALSAFFVSNADARGNFVPTTNLAGFKKPAPTTVDFDATNAEFALLSSSEVTKTPHSLKTRGGNSLITPAKINLSFYAELGWTISISIFMLLWLYSMKMYDSSPTDYVDKFPNFNKMVLRDGFCINPNPSGPSGLGTLKLCGIADALLIICSYFAYKDKLHIGKNRTIFFFCAGYTFLHGSLHFLEINGKGDIWNPNKSLWQNALSVGSLTLITAITPMGISDNFKQANKKGGLIIGITAWIAFVLLYIVGIKDMAYALTYINVTIFLSLFGSRTFLFKKDDPKRLKYYTGSSVLLTVLAVTANIVVMCIEPLVCKAWFASVGGHIWFDVTLWLMFMSVMALKED